MVGTIGFSSVCATVLAVKAAVTQNPDEAKNIATTAAILAGDVVTTGAQQVQNSIRNSTPVIAARLAGNIMDFGVRAGAKYLSRPIGNALFTVGSAFFGVGLVAGNEGGSIRRAVSDTVMVSGVVAMSAGAVIKNLGN